MRIDPEDFLAPRQPKKAPSLVDRVRLDLRKDLVQDTATTLLSAGSPDNVAEANKLASRFGIAPPVVEGNIEAFKRRKQIEEFSSLALTMGGLSSWAADPRNAAVALDDSENIGLLGNAWQGIKNIGSSLKAGSLNAISGAGNLTAGVIEEQVTQYRSAWDDPNSDVSKLGLVDLDKRLMTPVLDMLTDIQQYNQREAAAYQVNAARARPQVDNWVARNLLSGIESVPSVGMGIAIGAATRSPGSAAAFMSLPVTGNAYRDARDKGLSPEKSLDYAVTQGGIEYLTEKLPASRLLGDIAAKSPLGKKILGQLVTEVPGEQAATLLQDLSEWTTLNPEKTLGDFMRERPERAGATLLATVAGIGGTVGAVSAFEGTANAGKKLAKRVGQSRQASEEGAFLDAAHDAAVSSKVRERDPEAFKSMMDALAEESPNNRIYIPAEDVVAYMQSDSYDGSFDAWSSQAYEASATGGDVVIPVSDALARLAGTQGWTATRNSMRLSPGGQSASEAQTFDEAITDVMAELTNAVPDRTTGRDLLFQSVADSLMNAGFTPTIARTQAELLTQRYATRQERKGGYVSGDEFAGVKVEQILPEKLAIAQKVSGLDPIIDALKRNAKGEGLGPSLAEFIAKRGGIEDAGGDLASMGADKWHIGKPGRRKLIKAFDKNQGSMLATDGPRDTQIERVFQAAIDAGYFPELEGVDRATAADALDNNTLLDALGAELGGTKRFAKSPDTTLADGAAELERILRERGLDPKAATRKEIAAAVEAYSAEQGQGAAYEQADTSSEAFKRWFGESKVVDAKGRPLVVYHGSPDLRELNAKGVFQTNDERAAEAGFLSADRGVRARDEAAYFFTPDKKAASTYTDSFRAWDRENAQPGLVPTYISLQNPAEIDFNGERWTGTDAAIAAAKAEGRDGVIIRNVRDHWQSGKAKKGDKPHMVVVAFDPTQIKSVNNSGAFDPNDPRILNQSYGDGPRGRILFPDTGFDGFNATIELFQARDLSTFLHESGHLWLEELRFDALDMGASDQLQADWMAVQQWFSDNGHPVKDGVIPVEAHEMWARGVERYLMEGKAPVAGLQRLFEAFKTWLVGVYRTVGRLNSPLTDDVRGVMDRLVATDEELAAAAQTQNIELLFKDAETAGMPPEEFAGLQDLATAGRTQSNEAMLAKVMTAIRARVTKEYKERAAVVREEVTGDVDGRAVFRALKALKAAPMDADWVRERMGGDVTGRLPPNVPPLVKSGGGDPSEIAEMAGFKTPQAMVEALLAVEVRRKELREAGDKRSVRVALIEQEVEAIMNERYGDPFTDGSIEDEALAYIHNDAQGEVMAAELRVLSRTTGNAPTPYRVARDWARNRVRSGIVNDVSSLAAIQRYQRAAAKAGKSAQEAMMSGDRDAAFRAKQQQMLNNALVSEAKSAQEEVESALTRLSKVAKRRTSDTIDQDYLERAQGLLEQVDLRPRSQANINRQAQFEEWARGQEAEGVDVVVPPSFAASLGTTPWSRLAVDEFLGLDAAVTQIIHLGRLKQSLIDGKEKREFNSVVGEALDGMAGMPKKPTSDLFDPSWWDSVKSGIASADVALLKIETIVDWLDDGKSDGVFNRIVFKPIADAQDRENDMLAEYQGKLGEALGKLSKEDLRRWSEPVAADELLNSETGNPWKGTRSNLVAMALNVGNAGNRQRLVDGYGWNEGQVMAALSRELTASDWAFVQEVWDIIDGLWPETAAMERRVNGIAPEKVEAIPVETPFGILRGGYYPAIYDSTKDFDAERNAQREADLFATKYTRATTTASSTKERASAVKRPILLQLGVINRHIGEVIHDITHREAVMQAHKFLSEPKIKRAIDETLGREYRQAFTPWLKFVANQWATERAGNEGIGKFMNGLRSNTTVVGMGFRFTTVVMQAAGYSNSIEYIGAEWAAKGMAQFTAHPVETFDAVMEKSGEMRHRMDTLDRDIRTTVAKMAGKQNPLTAAKRFAFHGIGYMDRMVTIPTWIGAYNKALAAGKSDDQAVYAADKAIRLSQGSASPKDLAAVATGQGQWGQALKLMTLFYSYVSTVYQRQRTFGRDVKRGGVKDIPQLAARAWWLLVVPPILAELMGGRGPEEDEDWGAWAFKTMLFQSVGAIPVIRDAARPLYDKLAGNRGFDYQLSPIQRSVQTIINAGGEVKDIATGEETTRATRTILEATGYITGMVPGQLAQSTQFLVDVGYGEQDPQTFGDWVEGLTKGKIKE